MKGVFSSFFTLTLLGFLVFAGTVKAQNPGFLCNETFRFCVKYPPSLLNHQNIQSDLEDIYLNTFDGLSSVTVEVKTTYELLEPRQLYDRTLLRITGSEKKPTFVTTVFGDDYFEAFLVWDIENYFIRSYIFRSYYIQMIIRTPVNKTEIMSRLREDVDIALGVR